MTRDIMKAMWMLLVVCAVGCGGNHGGVTDVTPEAIPPADTDDLVAGNTSLPDTPDVATPLDVLDTTDTTLTLDALDTFDATDGDLPCVPVCEGKECGSDECGGSCGECEPGFLCQENGLCYPDDTPVCTGKECGPDGFGGSCGTCEDDNEPCTTPVCDPDGQCGFDVSDFYCVVEGSCLPSGTEQPGNMCLKCLPDQDQWGWSPVENWIQCGAEGMICHDGQCCPYDCDGKECGIDGCGGNCGECEMFNSSCHDGACICEPDCADKSCGPDGCGGSCHLCPDGMPCGDGACPCPEGTDLWVDSSLPGGTPGTGTIAQPFPSLVVAMGLVQPEDTLHLMPGYHWCYSIDVPCIEIRGETKDVEVGRMTIEASDVTLRGLDISGGISGFGLEALGIENLHLDTLEVVDIQNYWVVDVDIWGKEEQEVFAPAPVAISLTDVENVVIKQVVVEGIYGAKDPLWNWSECATKGYPASGLRCEGCTNVQIDGLQISDVRGGAGAGDCEFYYGPCCGSDGGDAYGIQMIASTWVAVDVSISQVVAGLGGTGCDDQGLNCESGSDGMSYDIFESP